MTDEYALPPGSRARDGIADTADASRPAAPDRAGRPAERRQTGVQAVVALTVMTLFVPCVANFLMMVRERGLKTGLAILGVVTPVAILTGAGLNHVLRTFGIQF